MKKFIANILLSAFMLCSGNVFTQLRLVDSLKQEFRKLATSHSQSNITCNSPCYEDTLMLKVLVRLSDECEIQDIIQYATPARLLLDKILRVVPASNQNLLKRLLRIKGDIFYNIALYHKNKGDIAKALVIDEECLKIRKQIDDKVGVAYSLNNIGSIYDNQGQFSIALEYYDKSLKIHEALQNKDGIATSLNNLAGIYNKLGDYKVALEYYNKALHLLKEIGDKSGIAYAYNNIGFVFVVHGKKEDALLYFRKSLDLRVLTKDKLGIANSLNNIGSVYFNKGEYDTAMVYIKKALALRKEIDDKEGEITSFSNVAAGYLRLSERSKLKAEKLKLNLLASAYSDTSLLLSIELGFPSEISNSELLKSKTDAAIGKDQSAFVHYKQYIVFRDSISNQENQKISIKSQLKHEYEKKEAIMNEQQEKEKFLAREKDRFQKIVIAAVISGFILVGIFALFVFYSLKTTRVQKKLIEEKQKDILDSIYYARKIQRALITNEKYINKQLLKLKA